MGVFVPVPSGVQAIIYYSYATIVISNRLWFTNDVSDLSSLAQVGLVEGLLEWHTTYILPYLSVDITLIRVQATVWESEPVPGPTYIDVALTGGIDSPGLSANVAVVVPFRWPLGSRERRNKHFIPGIPDSEVDLNTVSDAFSDAMFEAYSALVDDARDWYPGSTWRWRVASAFDGGAPRSEQFVRSAQGASFRRPYKLGQRRKRLG